MFKDHVFNWCQTLLENPELDARFKCQTSHAGMRHFKKGVSKLQQWSGGEPKDIARVFGCMLPGGIPQDAVAAAHALLDFINYAQYHSHTSDTLAAMDEALVRFHQHKTAFVRLGIHKDFEIPKLHSLLHYTAMIGLLGSADGYNTETPERMHIDFAKKAYKASNRRDYYKQMTRWLSRQAFIAYFSSYLTWLAINPTPTEDNLASNAGSSEDKNGPSSSEQPEPLTSSKSKVYSIAKSPAYPRMSLQAITDGYKASEFSSALQAFLTACRVRGVVGHMDAFGVYNGFKLQLPCGAFVDDSKSSQRI